MEQGASRRKVAVATLERPGECCPYLHEAVELVGKGCDPRTAAEILL